MLEAIVLMEIHGFCDTTYRLLYKWSLYRWKLVLMCYNALQTLMSSLDIV